MPVQAEIVDYQVVHAISGRVRIKIPRLRRDPEYAKKLQQSVTSLDAVTDVRVNPASASLVVQYNPGSVAHHVLWRELSDCIQAASQRGAFVLPPSKSPSKPIAPIKANSPVEKPSTTKADSSVEKPSKGGALSTVTKSVGIQIPDEYLSETDQFPIHVDPTQKVFEVGIPTSYIIQPLNAELDKFEAEHEKNTALQRIKLDLEAFPKEGGFLINGKARGQFREFFVINPFTWKKHYTPWVSMTALGSAELAANVVDETINVHLTKLYVSGPSGKWYRKLVNYAFENIFKTRLIAKINETLSQINGAKIQQLFFKLQGDKKLREHSQELGLTPDKLDELLELIQVDARLSSEYMWLTVQL